jgi:hypothetical protein
MPRAASAPRRCAHPRAICPALEPALRHCPKPRGGPPPLRDLPAHGETQDVSARLCDLRTRIITHRRSAGAGESAAASLDTMRELMTRIEQYIAGMLTLLVQNVAHWARPP